MSFSLLMGKLQISAAVTPVFSVTCCAA